MSRVVFDDDADDRPSTVGPLPLEDRLWRHPSEVGAAFGTRTAARNGPPRPMWAVAVVAGITGAAVACTALAMTGSLSPRIVTRSAARAPVTAVTASTLPGPKTIRVIATEASRVVAQVQAGAGSVSRTGSAIVLQAGGVLLTSEALVRGASRVRITLGDGREVEGTVAGRDTASGLAVVTVPVTGLTPARASSTSARPGDLAVTVAGDGGASGEPSVTSGVVSSVGRVVTAGDATLWGMIETDRPLPDRADGAALVTQDGTVSGVCLTVGDDGEDRQTGYAVPIDVASMVGEELLTHGRVRYAWIGIDGAGLTADEAEQHDVEGGLRVDDVAGGGPADDAGLQPDDVVIDAAGTPLRSMDDLRLVLRHHRPGADVALTVLRSGTQLAMKVTLTEQPRG